MLQPSHVIVADDVPGYIDLVSSVIQSECFGQVGDPSVQIVRAQNGLEALDLVREIRSLGGNPAISADLHMDPSGLMPEHNGDRLVAQLYVDCPSTPFALVTGTIADPRRTEVAFALEGVTIIDKDALSPLAPPEVHSLAVQRLRRALCEPSPVIEPLAFAALGKLTTAPFDVEESALLIAEAKARLHAAFVPCPHLPQKYPLLLEVIPHGLFRGDTTSNVHNFKNVFRLVVTQLTGAAERDSQLRMLLDDLEQILGWLTKSYAALFAPKDPVNVTAAVSQLVDSKLRAMSPNGVHLEILEPKLEVRVNAPLLHGALWELASNAVLHSSSQVEIVVGSAAVEVRNSAPEGGALSFEIAGNRVVSGVLPSTSTLSTGTGTGLRRLIAKLERVPGISLSLRQVDDRVIAELRFDSVVELRGHRHVEPDSSPSIKLDRPNVLFICKDGYVLDTFKGPLMHDIPGAVLKPIPTSGSFEEDGRYDDQPYFDQFIDADLCNQATLVIAHSTPTWFYTVFPEFLKRFPHLVYYPVSSMPEYNFADDKGWAWDGLPKSVSARLITPSAISAHYHASDPATKGQLQDELYCTKMSAETLATIVRIAHRIASAR